MKAGDVTGICSGCGEEDDILAMYLIFGPATNRETMRGYGKIAKRDQMYCCEDCFIPPPIDLAKGEMIAARP